MARSFWLAFVAVWCGLPLHAADWTSLQPQGYVSDFANVIDVASKSQLEAYCARLERATQVQLALVTVTSLQGDSVENAARSIARSWGVGHKNTNDGVLLLLATGDHKSRLEVGSGLSQIVPDSTAAEVLREMRPALRREHYGEALMAAAETLGNNIAQAKNVSLDANLPRQIRRSFFDSIPWPVVIGGLGLLFFFLRMGGTRGYGGWSSGGLLPALLLGSLMNRSSWGSRGSGGFGGPDSGDSFGGFGGGDFGGGGASGDW
jgi:uncharacterized protein